jgi:5-deoxy-glucuronate isomerase
MPPPSFGVQLVYANAHEPELATIVREDDIVLMPQGYHPNVAAPGGSINFLWMMAASREDVDRQFGVVNVQPEFAAGGSGLEPGRSERK